MSTNLYPARKLDWDDVCALIENRIAIILGHRVPCRAWAEDASYWSVSAIEYRFPIREIEMLLNAVAADSAVRAEAIPEDTDSSRSFGMGLSSQLLRAELNAVWEHEFHTAGDLWLINYIENGWPAAADLRLPGANVCTRDLKSRQELIDFLHENGPTHTSLMDFCESYRNRYQNELCWPYPISDGKHLGTFLIPVREGILSLPYDEADKEAYELFCLEDARMFHAADMEEFLTSWTSFSSGLTSAMQGMHEYLQRRERHEKD